MRPDERGVALLTVLLLVAAMSVMAVTVLDEIRLGLRRTANAEAVGQARWYAVGAEALAKARIQRLLATNARLTDWSGQGVSLPTDEGLIRARLEDGGNCFNLNSVVQGAGDAYARREEGVAQFVNLTTVLGLGDRQGEMLAAALVDWMDSDPLRESGGAEDESYDGYRTAGVLLAEVSELRAIRGFTPEVYARLRPFVCALPSAELSPLNLNTLRGEQAPLVAMLSEGPAATASVEQLLSRRPAAGYEDSAAFQALADELGITLLPNAGAQLQVSPRYFRLETEVQHGEAEAVSTALFVRDAAGKVRLAARRWGYEE